LRRKTQIEKYLVLEVTIKFFNRILNQARLGSQYLLIVLLLCMTPELASAQHSHGVLTPSVTYPQDDAVLREQPRMLTISFRVDVRLLKMQLYTNTGEWINLSFQWDPDQSDHNFVFPIPTELPPAEFYISKWSVVDENQRFLRGEFRFSFGPDATPPSEIIEASITRLEPVDGEYSTPFDSYRAREEQLKAQQEN